MSLSKWVEDLFRGWNQPDDKEEEVKGFVDGLDEKGFRYNEAQEWWQRTWTTPTPTGIESSLEVYKQDKETEEWKSIMYGSNGGIFYEHDLGKLE